MPGKTRWLTGGRSNAALAAMATVLLVPGQTFAQEAAATSLTDTIPVPTLDSMFVLGSNRFNDGSCLFCHAVGAGATGVGART